MQIPWCDTDACEVSRNGGHVEMSTPETDCVMQLFDDPVMNGIRMELDTTL